MWGSGKCWDQAAGLNLFTWLLQRIRWCYEWAKHSFVEGSDHRQITDIMVKWEGLSK